MAETTLWRIRRVLGTSLMSVLITGRGAMAQEGKIPSAPDAPLHQPVMDATMAHLRATLPDMAPVSDDTRAACEEFERAVLRAWMKAPTDTPAPRVIEMGEALKAAGQRDLMIDFGLGLAWLSQTEMVKARQALEKSAPPLLEGDYAPNVKALAATALSESLARFPSQREKAAQLMADATSFWIESLGAKTFEQAGPRVAFYEIGLIGLPSLPPDQQKRIYDALRNNPAVDQWLADVLCGQIRIKAAWDARGQGWASTVTEEGWNAFHSHLAAASESLTRAHAAHPERPEAAMQMIDVAMGQDDESAHPPRYWLDEAVRADFDWMEPYRRLLWALRPRWGGSHDAMLAFGRQCLETERFDTGVPMVYALAMRDVVEDQGWDWSSVDLPAMYPDFKRLFELSAAQAASDIDRRRYQSSHLALAWRVPAWDDANRLVEALDHGRLVHEAIMRDYGVFGVRDAIDDCVAHGRLPPDGLAEAAALADKQEHAKAAEKYASMQPQAGESKSVQRYLQRAIIRHKWLDQFNRGEWVDITPTSSDLLGWRPVHGEWKIGEDGKTIGTSVGTGLVMDLDVDFGTRFEFEARAHFDNVDAQTNAAMILNHYEQHRDRYETLGVVPHTGEASQCAVRNGRVAGRKAMTIGASVTFNARVWDDRVVSRVDDQVIYAGLPIDMPEIPRSYVGLGSRDSSGAVRTFDRVRIRRLSEIPPELAGRDDE